MPDIDTEIELFEEETADVVEFSESVLSELPEDSTARLDAERAIESAIDMICDEFIAGASDLLSLGCERCIRAAADEIDPILHVRALRCGASERIWRACLEELQCFCSDVERTEISTVLADSSYEDSFSEYQDRYLDCKHGVYGVFARTTDVLRDSRRILERGERSGDSGSQNSFGGELASHLINYLDNKLISAASRCDELLDDIYLINQKVQENQTATALRFNASTCNQRSLKPKVNSRLLTLRQTVALINEFWDAKAKNDASCRKEGRSIDTAREFIAAFYACKIGAGNTRSKQPRQLAYSAGYYAQESAICAIFCAEMQGDIDEAFKLMCLEQERRVSQIAYLYLNKLCEEKDVPKFALSSDELREIAARAYQVTAIDATHIIDDLYAKATTATLHDFLNRIDLESLREHRQKLQRLSEAFKFYDVKKTQRLNRDNFCALIAENYPQCDAAKLYEQATEGHSDITFSQSVFVMGPTLFAGGNAEQEDSAAPADVQNITENSEGLRINDLK